MRGDSSNPLKNLRKAKVRRESSESEKHFFDTVLGKLSLLAEDRSAYPKKDQHSHQRDIQRSIPRQGKTGTSQARTGRLLVSADKR